jgi:hypothetical protein
MHGRYCAEVEAPRLPKAIPTASLLHPNPHHNSYVGHWCSVPVSLPLQPHLIHTLSEFPDVKQSGIVSSKSKPERCKYEERGIITTILRYSIWGEKKPGIVSDSLYIGIISEMPNCKPATTPVPKTPSKYEAYGLTHAETLQWEIHSLYSHRQFPLDIHTYQVPCLQLHHSNRPCYT